MQLLSFDITHSKHITVNVATSAKKDGTLRIRTVDGFGGHVTSNLRGVETHMRKVEGLAGIFSAANGDKWEIKDFVYIDHPRQYYASITNGEDTIVFQYITTEAPGSGQHYVFSPLISKKRVSYKDYPGALAAWMLKNRFPFDLETISRSDRQLMIDLIRQDVTADVIQTAMTIMR